MKTNVRVRSVSFLGLCIGLVFPLASQAQQNAAAPEETSYAIVERTPNSRLWERATMETNVSGVVRTNFHSYQEIRSGLCHVENGAFVDSSDEIDLVADGAQAVHGQAQVHWAANANTQGGGAVRLVMAGGDVLQSTVFGISYWDSSTDTNVL